MRDVSPKPLTLRTARATALIRMSASTISAIRSGDVPKADPIATARIAGIQAAKDTSSLIPYCHQVPLDHVSVEFSIGQDSILVTSDVKAIWRTGVEMEALVSASAAALTLYDMLKIIDDTMEIQSIKLLGKTGGKSSRREDGKGLTAAVLVLSDSVSKGEKQDASGQVLAGRLEGLKFRVLPLKILPDEPGPITQELKRLADEQHVDLIATTGGTGIGPRDVTPEATLSVIERRLDGVEEALRSYGQDRLPMAMLSRSVVGVRGRTLIINFPGSTGGVEDGVNAIFPAVIHVFRMLRGEGH